MPDMNVTVCIIDDKTHLVEDIIQSLEEGGPSGAADSERGTPVMRYAHIRVGYNKDFAPERFATITAAAEAFLEKHNAGKHPGKTSSGSAFFSFLGEFPKDKGAYNELRDTAFEKIKSIITDELGDDCVILLDLNLFDRFEDSFLRRDLGHEILSMKIYHEFKERCILYTAYMEVEIGPNWARAYQQRHNLRREERPRIYNREDIEYGPNRNTETIEQLLDAISRCVRSSKKDG